MKALAFTPLGVAVALGLAVASCADLWGFEGATEASDAGTDASLALQPGPVEPGDSAPAAADAYAPVERVDAFRREDAPRIDARPAPVDASVSLPTRVEAGPAAHDAPPVAPPVGPICDPPCMPGASCVASVGGISVCVGTDSCSDSIECGRCCIWLDVGSSTGLCMGPGPVPTGVSCLCSPDSPERGWCKSCDKPAGFPLAGVQVCGDDHQQQ